MNLSDFTVGRVVWARPNICKHPGHVRGFRLNHNEEVIVVVAFPMFPNQYDDKYDIRTIHPVHLRFEPVDMSVWESDLEKAS